MIEELRKEIAQLHREALKAITNKEYDKARDLQVEIKSKEVQLQNEIFNRKAWK